VLRSISATHSACGEETMPRLQPDGDVPGRFPTMQWSRVVTAASREAPEARQALAVLCQAYWYPTYADIRHRRHTAEQAKDLTQDLFADILERALIAAADPTRGRFRAFVRTVRAANWPTTAVARTRCSRGADAPLPALKIESSPTREVHR
jgi:hypothetical protein